MQNTFTKLQKAYIITLGDNVKNELINDINNYISYLNDTGLYVTVHGKGIGGLLEHNIHRNPFCTYVKTDSNAWRKCIAEHQKDFCKRSEKCFFGMCHAGVEEYVFFANDNVFVSVSGYGIDESKAEKQMKRLTDNYFLEYEQLAKIYKNDLKHRKEDLEKLSVIIKPLCHMLNALQINILKPQESNTNSMFDSMLGYIQFNFMQEITIDDIAYACACSPSTVSHIFKSNTGVSIKSYIGNLRIEQAKELLKTSNLPVSAIATLCGFSNINYFT